VTNTSDNAASIVGLNITAEAMIAKAPTRHAPAARRLNFETRFHRRVLACAMHLLRMRVHAA
jgi:hypothetical protein